MNNLIHIRNDTAVCTSLQVAEKFHKRHDKVLRAIDGLLGGLPKNEETCEMFVSGSYIEEQNGQVYRMFYMNRDGFSLLAMGFTGKDALRWKLEYIKAFKAMESLLLERQSPHWQATRLESKTNRRMETDEIEALVEYAKANGSKNADKYYVNFTKLANKVVGIPPDSRDAITASQLNNLILIEHIIGEIIKAGIRQGSYYKDIYQACKKQLEQFTVVAFLKAG